MDKIILEYDIKEYLTENAALVRATVISGANAKANVIYEDYEYEKFQVRHKDDGTLRIDLTMYRGANHRKQELPNYNHAYWGDRKFTRAEALKELEENWQTGNYS